MLAPDAPDAAVRIFDSVGAGSGNRPTLLSVLFITGPLSVRFWSKKIILEDDIIESKQRRLLNQIRQVIQVKHYSIIINHIGIELFISIPNFI